MQCSSPQASGELALRTALHSIATNTAHGMQARMSQEGINLTAATFKCCDGRCGRGSRKMQCALVKGAETKAHLRGTAFQSWCAWTASSFLPASLERLSGKATEAQSGVIHV